MLTQQTRTTEQTPNTLPLRQQTIRTTQISDSAEVQTGSPQSAYQKKKVIFRTYQVIWYIVGVMEVLLAFRILLRLLGADAQSGFTNFVYSLSNPFALPFAGIVGTSQNNNMVVEWSTLIAMAVYAVIAYGITAFFKLVKPTDQEEVERSVDNQG